MHREGESSHSAAKQPPLGAAAPIKGSKTPLQAMKHWHKLKPELFNKLPYYRPGCDSYA
ncbi:hypothetical protein [Pseudophaeobacter sp. TrK17]|uniref:hypothetical protein n=1 Tax=Pseudophaeobacter sp. TrK17 TaxID=2815167 RepID=UPI0035D05B07